MDGVEGMVVLVDEEGIVDDGALPLVLLAQPHRKGFILQHTVFVLEETGNQPLALLTQNLYYFQQSSKLGLDQFRLYAFE